MCFAFCWIRGEVSIGFRGSLLHFKGHLLVARDPSGREWLQAQEILEYFNNLPTFNIVVKSTCSA